jgi:two-component system, sensor histidine kinase and response regulator
MAMPFILNVDDYAPGRYSRTKILTQAGFTVQEAATGRAALLLMDQRPDLVLLDVNLPDINGMEVCRQIKANPVTASTMVVHLTASSMQTADQVLGLNNGADSYLTEPIEPEILIASVRAMLRVRAAEEALRRSNDELRSLTHLLSHELREPLRSVTAFTQLLDQSLRGKLTGEQEEFMARALAGSARMEEFIQSVLAYAKTEHDTSNLTEVSADEVLNACLAELQLMIAESGSTIIREPLPTVRATKMTLARVFTNLISNAIKYRGAEPPLITITAQPHGRLYLFCCKDNGMGVAPEYHSKIFDLFKRLHGAELSGVGIGLSLCRRIIENLGGTIWVESGPGSGAAFYFTLPRGEAKA